MFGKKQSIWPFILFIIGVIILFSFIFWSNGTFVRAPIDPLPGCVIVDSTGPSETNIDIVFLGTNYDSVGEFIDDTYFWKEELLKVEPFNSNRDKFNFYRIENFEDYGCEWDKGYILCNTGKIVRASSICPHDYFVVLTDIDGVYNLINWLRSSTYQKVMAINTADDPLVLAHEMGHAFGNFAEEYTEEGISIWWDAPNCDSDMDSCSKFDSVDNTSCIAGCTNFEYSRSVKEGIMRDYWHRDGKTYGLFDEYILSELIYDITSSSAKPEVPEDILLVDIECESNNCTIISVEESFGFPDGKEAHIEEGSSMRMESSGLGDEKTVVFFEPIEKMFTCFKTGKVTKIKDTIKTVIIPREETLKLTIHDANGKLISEYFFISNKEDIGAKDSSQIGVSGSKTVDIMAVS
ncbi:hypothetical protein HOD61_02055 [archaeon]|jgi:hypothetical protein|nr:hypothetical protein [archaeon]